MVLQGGELVEATADLLAYRVVPRLRVGVVDDLVPSGPRGEGGAVDIVVLGDPAKRVELGLRDAALAAGEPVGQLVEYGQAVRLSALSRVPYPLRGGLAGVAVEQDRLVLGPPADQLRGKPSIARVVALLVPERG